MKVVILAVLLIGLGLAQAAQAQAPEPDETSAPKKLAPKAAISTKTGKEPGNSNPAAIGLIVLAVLALSLALVAYFMPALVASHRGHQNAPAIFVMNLLFGWTFLGWGIAMVWAFTAVERRRRYSARDELQPW